MINTYKISCLEDFDAFCREKNNLKWASGLSLSNTEVRNAIISRKFPLYLEVDKQNFVLITNSTPKNAIIYSAKEQPISLMTSKREQGIYLVDENGKETFFSIKDFIECPSNFINVVQESVSLEVGDTVKIIDAGESYSTYGEWFKENNISIDLAARYSFGHSVPQGDDSHYKIVAVGKHKWGDLVYAITSKYESTIINNSAVFLIGAKGVEKVADKMQYSWE